MWRAGGGGEDAVRQGADGVAEEGERGTLLLFAGLNGRTGHGLGLAAGVGAVAAEDLAVDDRGSQRLFGLVVGRGPVRFEQEAEPGVRKEKKMKGKKKNLRLFSFFFRYFF